MASHVPPGIRILQMLGGNRCNFSRRWYQVSVLILTFVAYTLFHLSRKPPSIVKSALDPDNNSLPVPHAPQPGWAPFNRVGGKGLLGDMDFAFLSSYAIGMYYAGHLGDHYDLRHFLSAGMVGSGVLVILFGMGYFWNIHSLYYFLAIQLLAGFFQATGWPSVVTIVANWYGKGRRGLIMGVWNAHTSCGNILGSVIASALLTVSWGWSFVVPGLMIIIGGVVMFLFLAVDPEDVGHSSPYCIEEKEGAEQDEDLESKLAHRRAAAESPSDTLASSHEGLLAQGEPLLIPPPVLTAVGEHHHHNEPHHHERNIISFGAALCIPGVIDFSICLFFTKLVAYTFLMWLPYYIQTTPIAGQKVSESTAGWLSTLFDVGGILGGILAGHLSDTFNAPARTSSAFMLLAIPGIYVYRVFGHTSMTSTVLLMILAGALVNGPYALITTAVSADLGTHSSISGDAKALATVTAIIDGTGSIGAALGPFLTGLLRWEDAFHMLMLSALLASVALAKAVWRELRGQVDGPKDFQHRTPTSTPRGSIPHTPFTPESPRQPLIEPGYRHF